MAEQEVETEVRAFILEELFEDADADDLTLDAPLLTGLLDSWALLQLLNFLEERYEISIAHHEVVDDNFASIRNVGRFVESKRAGAA